MVRPDSGQLRIRLAWAWPATHPSPDRVAWVRRRTEHGGAMGDGGAAALAKHAHRAWRRRARRWRPALATAAVSGAAGSLPWRRIPPPLRCLLRRSPLPPRPLRRQPGARARPVPHHPPKREPFRFLLWSCPAPRLTLVACASSEEVRHAVRRVRGEGHLRVQALQGQRHRRVVSDARPGVRQPVPLPYLRWDPVTHLRRRYCC